MCQWVVRIYKEAFTEGSKTYSETENGKYAFVLRMQSGEWECSNVHIWNMVKAVMSVNQKAVLESSVKEYTYNEPKIEKLKKMYLSYGCSR